jgi:hypothetical protein
MLGKGAYIEAAFYRLFAFLAFLMNAACGDAGGKEAED